MRIPRDVTIAYTHPLYLTYTNSVTVSTPSGIIGSPFISELYFARGVSSVALLEYEQLTGPNYPRSSAHALAAIWARDMYTVNRFRGPSPLIQTAGREAYISNHF
jgi:hypothetical protein